MNNENECEIDVPEENTNAGLILSGAGAVGKALPPEQINKPPPTAQQLRVVEVSEALAPAYQKASTLDLTEAEINGLTVPFADNKVEVRPHDGLIYIPHIHISNRLNAVFKPGKWSLICRRHWLENNTMYGEYILLIKGCYVGESVGGHPYIPNNPKTNYSDSLEATAAEALRRICGKRLSCGDQVWDPSYAEKWCEQYRVNIGGKYYKRMAAPATTPGAKPQAAQDKPKAPVRTEETRKHFIARLEAAGLREQAIQFLIDLGWIMPNETLEKMELRNLPLMSKDMSKFETNLKVWAESGVAEPPYERGEIPQPAKAEPVKNVPQRTILDNEPEDGVDGSDASSESWYEVIVPVPHKGEKRDQYLKNPDTIGSLYEARHDDEQARKRLWGFVNHYQPQGWQKKDGTKMPPSKADVQFREALDEFSDWFETNHPDENK